MPSKKANNQKAVKGFTIIEVVLVLAIAGLIFLMVFVALPALQRSQRDTARRNDMARVSTSLVQYQTNHSTSSSNLPDATAFYNGGAYTANNVASDFVQRYMNSGTGASENSFKDPSGKSYQLQTVRWGNINSNNVKDPASLVAGTAANSWTVGSKFDDHIIYIISGATCDGEDAVKSGDNNYAVLYRLEGAGVYCVDDQ